MLWIWRIVSINTAKSEKYDADHWQLSIKDMFYKSFLVPGSYLFARHYKRLLSMFLNIERPLD